MDRIASLRRIEDTLADIEAGETDLEGCEWRVRATVRTFTTKFDGDLAAYEAEDRIVVAASDREARECAWELTAAESPMVERLV